MDHLHLTFETTIAIADHDGLEFLIYSKPRFPTFHNKLRIKIEEWGIPRQIVAMVNLESNLARAYILSVNHNL